MSRPIFSQHHKFGNQDNSINAFFSIYNEVVMVMDGKYSRGREQSFVMLIYFHSRLIAYLVVVSVRSSHVELTTRSSQMKFRDTLP